MIHISPFTLYAYEEVLALWNESEGVGLSDADSRESICSYLDRNPNLSLLARDREGNIVGAVLCGHDGRRGYIHHLAVRPGFRRQGIGRALVQECLSGLKAAGIQKCHIFIFGANVSGIAFWQNLGWVSRSDIHVMSKTIDR